MNKAVLVLLVATVAMSALNGVLGDGYGLGALGGFGKGIIGIPIVLGKGYGGYGYGGYGLGGYGGYGLGGYGGYGGYGLGLGSLGYGSGYGYGFY